MLDTLQALAQRLDDYVSSMLNGTYQNESLVLQEVELNDVVEAVRSLLAFDIEQAQAQVTVRGSLPISNTSLVLVTRIFLNLVSNAIRHNDNPIPLIEIGWDNSNPGALELYVSDNGPGIPVSDLETVFESEYHVLDGKNRVGGQGLGMAIVRQSVERLGGKVWVEPNSEIGVRVQFTLPKHS